MTGDSVVLHTGVREINREKQILWLFGPKKADTLIAEIYKLSISIYDSYEGIKDRLQMDQQTGSLTVRNITTSHSGHYTAQIMNAMTTFKRFSVMVYGELHYQFRSFLLHTEKQKFLRENILRNIYFPVILKHLSHCHSLRAALWSASVRYLVSNT